GRGASGHPMLTTKAVDGHAAVGDVGSAAAIIPYETAVGAGMALGPLVGGTLGSISWRAPFLGTALMMGLAAATLTIFVKPADKPSPVPLMAGFSALREKPLLLLAATALCYNFSFI